jgi:hypothetical protein
VFCEVQSLETMVSSSFIVRAKVRLRGYNLGRRSLQHGCVSGAMSALCGVHAKARLGLQIKGDVLWPLTALKTRPRITTVLVLIRPEHCTLESCTSSTTAMSHIVCQPPQRPRSQTRTRRVQKAHSSKQSFHLRGLGEQESSRSRIAHSRVHAASTRVAMRVTPSHTKYHRTRDASCSDHQTLHCTWRCD